jgi:hypothetical protein
MVVNVVRYPLRGMVFSTGCCNEPLLLCSKGSIKFPLVYRGVVCPRCKRSQNAALESEPNWTHKDVPDCYPSLDTAKWQIPLASWFYWDSLGRPRTDLSWMAATMKGK